MERLVAAATSNGVFGCRQGWPGNQVPERRRLDATTTMVPTQVRLRKATHDKTYETKQEYGS